MILLQIKIAQFFLLLQTHISFTPLPIPIPTSISILPTRSYPPLIPLLHLPTSQTKYQSFGTGIYPLTHAYPHTLHTRTRRKIEKTGSHILIIHSRVRAANPSHRYKYTHALVDLRKISRMQTLSRAAGAQKKKENAESMRERGLKNKKARAAAAAAKKVTSGRFFLPTRATFSFSRL